MRRIKPTISIAKPALGLILAVSLLQCKHDKADTTGDELVRRLEEQGLSFPMLSSYTVKETSQLELKGHQVTRTSLESDLGSLEIKVIDGMDDDSTKKLIDQRLYQVESIFGEHKMPYPGDITAITNCPPEFLPIVARQQTALGSELKMKMNANVRKVVGACETKEARYRVFVEVLHCRAKKKIFDIQAFGDGAKPVGELERSLGLIACR